MSKKIKCDFCNKKLKLHEQIKCKCDIGNSASGRNPCWASYGGVSKKLRVMCGFETC